MKLRVFEAFAGYGSQSIALELLAQAFPDFQFDTVGISEIDKHAIKAYRTLHGNVIPNHGDITKIDWTQTADFDLLTYSFPCQDISSAGKQRGFTEGSGTRSSCLWACADAIETKHPRFLLMENVKVLATQKKFSDDFRRWREWLIKHGYTNYYAVLNAKDYGVPQNRERVFMVSFLGEHTPFYFPAPFELTRRLKHVLEDEVDEKYWLQQEQIQALIKHNERKQSEGCGFRTNFQTGEGISGAIKTKEGSREYDTYIKVPTYGNSRPAIVTLGNYSPSGHEASRVLSIEGIAPTVKENHGTINAIAIPRVIQLGNLIEDSAYKNPHRGRVYSVEGIAPCLNCIEGGQREPKIVVEYWIRKLTPRECFRLMDVPERYIDRLLSAGISNSQLYKLAGNSIVVACLYHIFRKMFCETARESCTPISHSRETPAQLSLF